MAYALTLFLATVAGLPTPSPQQLHYLENELTMFMHFSVCTFNGCLLYTSDAADE